MKSSESLTKRVEEARAFVESEWSDDRALRVEASMGRRKKARAQARRVGLVVGVLAVSVFSAWLAMPSLERAHIEKMTAATVVEKSPAGARLVTGGARFEVRVDHAHPFTVASGEVEVSVVGTQFLVERIEAQVHVAVEKGVVRVRWPTGERVLSDGESGLFPPAPAQDTLDAESRSSPSEVRAEAPAASAPAMVDPPKPLLRAPRAQAPTWQELAHGGQFDAAWVKLKQPRVAPRDLPEELLLAADVARLTHHPEEAVAPLSLCVSSHPTDPRAPLAAFTLGRVLLDELGRPRQAAEAFTTALRLAPDGPLAEDALARAVESWSRAGEPGLAKRAATEYLRQFPHGQREAAVRRQSGLE